MGHIRSQVKFDRATATFIGLDDAAIDQLRKLFPNNNIDRELEKMKWWLCVKGRNRVGTIGFIMNWLERNNEVNVQQASEMVDSNTPLGELLKDYMEGLWKNRDHILSINTLTRS